MNQYRGESRRPLLLRGGTALLGDELEERPFDAMGIIDGHIVSFEGVIEDAVEVDLAGAWVVPGLIDMHVHLELTAAPAPFAQWDASMPDRMIGLARNGLVALASGILTVRDLGNVDDSVIGYGRMTATRSVLGPNVIASGRPIAMTGGHLWQYARQADGPHEVRRAVREQVRAGAGVIKVMATGGLTTPGLPGSSELGEDELSAAVVEASNAGLAVAAHAHGADGVLAATRAGVATIEHGGLIGADECAAMIAARTALVPTLSPVFRLPADARVADDVVAKTHAIRATYATNIARAIRDGVAIVAGTDAGCAFNPIGGLVDELGEYVGLGMSHLDALKSATVRPGKMLGIPAGVLEIGSPADLVVARDDPRQDVAVLNKPVAVIRRGQMLDPAWLEEVIGSLGGRDEASPLTNAAEFLEEGS